MRSHFVSIATASETPSEPFTLPLMLVRRKSMIGIIDFFLLRSASTQLGKRIALM
jgi:hypothetical protein